MQVLIMFKSWILEDTASAIRNKLIDLLSEIKGFQYASFRF